MRLSNHHTRVRIAVPTDDEGDALDRWAFGFAVGDIITLMPDQIGIQYEGDLENPEGAIEGVGDPVAWARSVSLRKPIDVTYRQGRFWVEDGHHRWTAARILKKKLRCKVVKIDDNPILALQTRGLEG
jgi:hypothetical protein